MIAGGDQRAEIRGQKSESQRSESMKVANGQQKVRNPKVSKSEIRKAL